MSSSKLLKPEQLGELLTDAFDKERSGQSFGAAGLTLKNAMAESRRCLLGQFARGDVIAVKISELMDGAIAAIYANAAQKFPPKAKLAVAAAGGYGRGSLAPYSDIDLLILHSGVKEELLKPIVNDILYPLWDADFIVGQGVHTPASAAKLAASDMTAMTAVLDARFIAGDKKLFKDFAGRIELLRYRKKSKFIKAKMAELEGRHERSMQSRYLAEPDIKEGKGGLRDIHAIGWIYRGMYGRALSDAPKRGALFKPDEIESLKKAERFLMSLRVHLHDLRGRADERLTFEIQPALAERLGYAGRADMTATERMMKHYFVTAVEIGRLTRIFWARIEEENAKLIDRAPTPLPKLLGNDEAGGKINLRIKNGRLDFASAAAATKTPRDIFRYFRAFAKKPEIDFHPDALALIAQMAPSITSEVRRDPVNAKLFVAALMTAKDPVKLLRVMSETGFLGKYIPSFGQITGRIEYGLYRRFSLDEHIFQSVGILTKMCNGEFKDKHPISSGILSRYPAREMFYIAVLLHEAGGSLKDRTVENTQALVGRVARRLGANDEEAMLISWCAARPLFMVRIAERRNIGEARAIADFAGQVASIERLDLLLVLTVCHLRVVSESAWDEWTRRQISSLYFGAKAWFEGGEDGLQAWMRARADLRRGEVEIALPDWSKEDRKAFLARLSDEAISMLDAGTLSRAAALAKSADICGVAASITEEAIEAIVYADDRPGLLADFAGAVAGVGGSVRNMHALTLDDGKIIDVFTIHPPEGMTQDLTPDFVRRLHGELLSAARARPAKAPALSRRLGDRRAIFRVPPKVTIDCDASADALVVEAEGRDRPGLLYSLTSALADLGFAIRSAHIATYGERAVDAFYIQDETGAKITDRRRIQLIEKRLLAVLGDGAPASAKTGV